MSEMVNLMGKDPESTVHIFMEMSLIANGWHTVLLWISPKLMDFSKTNRLQASH